MTDSIILKAKDLRKSYQMGEVEVQALRGVDVEVRKGNFVVLLGHSGSGKSTLLNILGGLDQPSSGKVYFGNSCLDELNDNDLTSYRRKNIGFVFQMYNLIPRLSAAENIEIVTSIADNPLPAHEALSLVDLSQRADHFPGQMSGGEQQRVAIARAIAKQPTLLFCDEPTGALDLQTGIKVLEAIQSVNESLQTTIIVITHNASIADMADEVLVLADGQIRERLTNSRKKRPRELRW